MPRSAQILREYVVVYGCGRALAAAVFSRDYEFVSVSERGSGDSYAFEWEMIGTNTGEAAGLPATNRPFRIRGVSGGTLDSSGKIKHGRGCRARQPTRLVGFRPKGAAKSCRPATASPPG
jgi:hypothetical protein